MFLEELLISSFIPEGYLGREYFGVRIAAQAGKPDSLLVWRRFVARKLHRIAKDYADHNRKVDKAYLEGLLMFVT